MAGRLAIGQGRGYSDRVNLDKHRDSLAKYCYDLSKVIVAVSVLNPLVTKPFNMLELVIGVFGGVAFLALAILIEKGKTP